MSVFHSTGIVTKAVYQHWKNILNPYERQVSVMYEVCMQQFFQVSLCMHNHVVYLEIQLLWLDFEDMG